MDYAIPIEMGERVLSKAYRLGEWKTSCGVRFLISKSRLRWKDSLDFCCSLGMRLVSIQSFEKLMCLESVVPNEELQWCSPEFKDFVKSSVNLNSTYSGKKVPQRCVKAKNSKAEGVRLSVDNCEINLHAICEIFGPL
ncbi:Hypothetical predicted protein [Cloeon dipterum]|uniref:C-type lectin domain-containing protein n=1 Tax=Cloeon dipterum TaxID=197152 RepID=A0A8S1DF53_9INSE|nr:Hypothetical predicted protein [Cloeon dipterum]